MTAPALLNGATRLIGIIGDPIAQVKSPATLTRIMQEQGHNAVCVPLHVSGARRAGRKPLVGAGVGRLIGCGRSGLGRCGAGHCSLFIGHARQQRQDRQSR